MSNESESEQWEDYAVKTVKKLKNEGDLVAALFLCSAFIEHYCRTKIVVSLLDRPLELIKVEDKTTKKTRQFFVLSEMRQIVFEQIRSHWEIIKVGFLLRAWNKEVYDQLLQFNTKRNRLTHQHDNILRVLEEDEGKKEAEEIIALGLSLLDSIKRGYVKT